MLLETLLFNLQKPDKTSLVDYSTDLAIYHEISITKQSLDERLNSKAVKFVKHLLDEAIIGFSQDCISTNVFSAFKKVKIKDSTSFQLPDNMASLFPGNGGGSSKATARIQFEYDLKTNRVEELQLQSTKTNDYMSANDTIDKIEEGELVIRDLGYITLDILEKINKAGAFYLNRIQMRTALYEKKNGKFERISFTNIEKRLRKSGLSYLVKNVYVGNRRYMPARVIFSLVPEDKKQERLKRQLRKAERRGNKPHSGVLEAIGLNVFITNTTQEQLPAQELYNVYRLRWQIELIFKGWKQICQINKVKKTQPYRCELFIYTQLLWIILNWSILSIISSHVFVKTNKSLSIYKSLKTLCSFKTKMRQSLIDLEKLKKLFRQITLVLEKGHFVEKRNGRVFSDQILAAFVS